MDRKIKDFSLTTKTFAIQKNFQQKKLFQTFFCFDDDLNSGNLKFARSSLRVTQNNIYKISSKWHKFGH